MSDPMAELWHENIDGKLYRTTGAAWALMSEPQKAEPFLVQSPPVSSPASEGSTPASPAPDGNTHSSARATDGGARCCGHGSPECRCTTTYALSENQRGELLLTDVAHQLTAGGGKPGQGYSAVAFLARTCPSPDAEQDSPAAAPACSTSSPASPGLFDLDGYSSRTYPDCSPAMAVGTSESCLERWPTSGTAWAGGFSTAVSSECRSDAEGCSSSESSLSMILEPPQIVPAKYSLSARAARGILRRAEKRGRTLPSHLSSALETVARTTTADRQAV